jgi:glycosidase
MNKLIRLKYRKRVKEKYLFPNLYKLGYQTADIESDAKLLVEKGRRKVYINAEVLVRVEGLPGLVISVRAGNEELDQGVKMKMISYSRLLSPPAPILVMTNGLATKVYDTYTEQELAEIPSKDELKGYLINQEIDDKSKERYLNNLISSVSLWDESKKKSPYHTYNMRSFADISEKTVFNSKLFHNHNYVPNLPTIDDKVSIRVSTKSGLIDKVYLYYTIDGTLPQGKKGKEINGTCLELKRSYTEVNPADEELIDWWEAKIDAQKEGIRVRYIIEGYNNQKRISYFADNNDTLAEASNFSYLVQKYQTPQWAKEAIVYHIIIDRFCDGDPTNNYDLGLDPFSYQGGDLQGIIDKLDYIKKLGATAIWLSPLYEGLYYHGYHITDFLEIDKHFGDDKLLHKLIDRAHSKGLKIILDFVPNHCSNKHPFFIEAQQDKDSKYYNWFKFTNWPNQYDGFFGLKELPYINNDYPAARKYTIYEHLLKWLKIYDFDGLRMDYAYGLSHDFWTEFRMAIKEIKPEAYVFGEVWEGPGITNRFAGELDGCFDFSLVWSFRELFIYGSKSVSEFKDDLDYLDGFYEDEFILCRFLDNHDMGRFLWEAEGDKSRLKLAATCQFTLAGTQFIYYGTEVGLSQVNDCRDDNTGAIVYDHSRNFMLWGEEQDKELYNFYQSLCSARNNHLALSLGERDDLIVDDQRGIWAYIKSYGQEELLIILNCKEEEAEVEVNLSGYNLANSKKLRGLLNNREYSLIDGRVKLRVPKLTGAILGC